jgi:gamma-glutamyltranspeptidase/glutathione hydrolase
MNRQLFVLALCVACASGQRKDFDRPVRQAARGTHGAIAAGSEFATQAGMRLYYHGGNAVDAGKVWAIAGVGTMPKLASAELFRTRKMEPGEILTMEPGGMKGIIPVAGIMPALVPGMVEAGLVTLREFGTKSFSDVVQPAVELADGFPIDEMRAGSIARSRRFFDLWPDSKRVFMPEGHVPMPGEIFHQPDLARTLRGMMDAEKKALAAGKNRAEAIDAIRDYFYRGEIAHKIDAFMKANHGLMRYEDMAEFRLKPEEPVSTEYRGYRVYKPGFWSQGPAMIETLNILEGFDLQSMGWNTADYIHKEVEALKLAYADRDTYFGDPKFNHIPTEVLLSKSYAAERRKDIHATASLDFEPGTINGKKGKHPTELDVTSARIDDALMARDTTCVDAIDKDGVMLSITPSGAWQPSVIAGDTGIELTERAQSFLLVQGSPNELAGGKRPRVTLSPTLVTQVDGKPVLVLSTPGGDNQDQSLLQVMLDTLEFGMNAQAAVEAPRYQTRHLVSSFDNHAWNRGDLLLDERIPVQVFQALVEKGHKVSTRSRWASGAAPVMIHVTPDGVIEAGADPYGYRVAHAY